jgi:hypothetical protein
MKALTPKIWVIALILSAQSAWADGDAAQGRKIAEQHCSRCHVIGDYNKFGGIGSTPSFQLMVNQLADYRERFQIFFDEHPHPAFLTIDGQERRMEQLPPNAAPVKLPLEAVADILAFAETLRKGK